MQNSDIAIKVENMGKYYRLGVINNGTLFRDIQSWAARKLGKEDPHSKIGSKYDPTAEGFWALKDLNFEIKKGDRVGIIGHNGAGKSTLLKLLSRITAPTEGSIKINGKISSLLEVGTGFHPELTGRENIYMNGAILGMKKREIDRKIDEIIDFSEIKEHIDTPVKRYSSGMYVRLAFAVAAHLDSDILIADEVLAVGDAAFQKKALGKMNELSSGEGRTVLFVSHNMAQVKNLCNKGIVLEKGRVVRQDTDIDKSINWYLGSTEDIKQVEGNSNFIEFEESREKKFQVKNVKIFTSHNSNSADFFSTDELTIKFSAISRSPIADMYGFFSIYSIEKNINVMECDSREFQTNAFNAMANGIYEFELRVPKQLLTTGSYYVSLIFGSGMEKDFYVDQHYHFLKFKIVDASEYRKMTRTSVTGVTVKWDLIDCKKN